MFSSDIFRNESDWPRAIQGDHSHEVIDPFRFQFDQIFGHAGGGKLENPESMAGGEHGVGFLVVQGDFFNLDIDAAEFFDNGDGVGQNGEVSDAENIQFDQTDVLAGVHFVLGDDIVAAPRFQL